jgi:hypothetical protein
MYMPNTCRLVWNKNYMLSEISVKVFRSGRNWYSVGPIVLQSYFFFLKTLYLDYNLFNLHVAMCDNDNVVTDEMKLIKK